MAGLRRGGLRAREGGSDEGGGITARWRAWAAALFVERDAEDGRGGGGMFCEEAWGDDCVCEAPGALACCSPGCVAWLVRWGPVSERKPSPAAPDGSFFCC